MRTVPKVGAAILLGLTALAGTAAQVQGWGDLDALLFPALTASGTAEASFWLPDAERSAAATEALGVVYEAIPGAAGNTSISVGLFRKGDAGFALAGLVDGVFGYTPRDALFLPDRIEITTTALAEGDPRCCPTGTTRWAIDRASLAAEPLR